MDQISSYFGFLPAWAVPPLVALLTIVIGFIIAKIAAALVAGAVNRTGIGRKAQTTGGNIGKSLSKAVFWVLWLVFILMGLSQFPMLSDQLGFLNGMMNDIFGYLPQLLIGAFVFAVGLMLANVVQNAVQSMLEVAQIDRLAARYNIGTSDVETTVPTNSIAKSIGKIFKAVVIILFAIFAIGIWDIPGISNDVTDMLGLVLLYIPLVAIAAVVLAISVFIGRFVSNLIKSTLPALGVDNSLATIAALDGERSDRFVPSNIIATIAYIAIVLMGLTAAMDLLNIDVLSEVFYTLLGVGGRVVLGAVIIGVGIFIANFVSRIVVQTSGELAGKIIKYATIIIVTFMGLETMQLGEGIVDTAFRYSVMAAAVAAGVGGAIAFGLGGREWAAKKLEKWFPTGVVRKK